MSKKEIKNKKQNLSFMLLVLLLISAIVCILSFGIATWARYRSVVGNNVVAQIAKWSFKVNGEEEQFANINLADTIAFEHVETTKIAPGTYGSFDLDIDARGSEVSLDYYININVAEKPTNLKFYSDSTHTTLIPISADNKIYLDGEFLLSNAIMQETRTIYWNWEYRTEEMPSSTVLQGYYSSIEGLETLVNEYNDNGTTAGRKQELALKINDKIDTYEQGGDVLLEVRVKGVQINPNFSLKRAQITSGKSQTYNIGDSVNLSLEFTENVYGGSGQSPVTNSNAPEVTLAFGGASANNPVAKVASLMSTNLKLSAGENVATFASVNGNKINYTYTIKSTDIGALRIASITGSVYNRDGKQINFGTVQTPITSIPEVVGGTISAQVAMNGNTISIVSDSAQLGDYVELGTNILDKTIALEDSSYPETDWRVFKKEENGTWLILADYMPQSKLPEGTGLSKSTSPYCINSSVSRSDLINGLNSSNWKELLSGTIFYSDDNIIVKGAVEIDIWLESWHLNENNIHVNLSKRTGMNETPDWGYYVYKNNESSTNTSTNISSSVGYNNSLYFPHKSGINGCYGYWLSSPSANQGRVLDWGHAGGLDADIFNSVNNAVRPVVFIPKSVTIPTANSNIEETSSNPKITVAGQTITLTKENAANYYGKVVTNYSATNSATWRLFYVDFDGKYGEPGKVYLKANQVSSITLNTTLSASSSNALAKMQQMNPDWARNDGNANANNEKAVLYLCDETQWSSYKNSEKADCVMGAPSLEMYLDSYNEYHTKLGTTGYKQIECGFFNTTQGVSTNGYQYLEEDSNGIYDYRTSDDSLKGDTNNLYLETDKNWWLASPSAYDATHVCFVKGTNYILGHSATERGICPVVSLKSNFTPELSN